MSAPDSVTVLRCAPGRRATKLITGRPDGSASVDGYDTGRNFSVAEHPVASIHELAALLDRLSRDASRFVIRGEPRPDINRRRCRRLLHRTRRPGISPLSARHRGNGRSWTSTTCPGPIGSILATASWPRSIARTLLPSLAAVLLLVGVVILGRLQARRADQARLLARPAGTGLRTRAAPQGLPDRLQHAAGRAADLRGPTDPAGRPRSDRAAHWVRAGYPRRRAPAGVAGRGTAGLFARRPKLRQRLAPGCCRAPPGARCAGP